MIVVCVLATINDVVFDVCVRRFVLLRNAIDSPSDVIWLPPQPPANRTWVVGKRTFYPSSSIATFSAVHYFKVGVSYRIVWIGIRIWSLGIIRVWPP